METLLGIGDGAHLYDNSPALVGDDEGRLHTVWITPDAIRLAERLYAKPHFVDSLIIRIPTINYPTPDYGLSIHPPIDVDAMIQGAVEGRRQVTAYPAMPTVTFRDLHLEGYRVGERMVVYCAFDHVDRAWYVHRKYY